jgi:hypothetical protein
VAQVLEHLPSKCKALNTAPHKKKSSEWGHVLQGHYEVTIPLRTNTINVADHLPMSEILQLCVFKLSLLQRYYGLAMQFIFTSVTKPSWIGCREILALKLLPASEELFSGNSIPAHSITGIRLYFTKTNNKNYKPKIAPTIYKQLQLALS